MHEFLRPIEQTMKICHMKYEDPFLVQGSNRLSEHDLALKAEGFKLRLRSALDQSV